MRNSRARFEWIREQKQAEPFVPFKILLTGGRTIVIRDKRSVTWDGDDPEFISCIQGGIWVQVHLASAVEILKEGE